MSPPCPPATARRYPVGSRPRRPRRVAATVVLGLALGVPLATAASAAGGPALAVQSPVLPPRLPAAVDPFPGAQESAPNRGPLAPAPPAPVTGEGRGWLGWTGIGLLLAVTAVLATVATTTLTWMLHAWRTPADLEATRFASTIGRPVRRFSLLVPARHEEAVLGETLDRLAAVDYPDMEVLAIVGHDDPGTTAVAEAAARRHPGRVRVVVDHSWPKNKPKALNTALESCRGDVVGVFDAEDEVHRDLLRHVDARFTEAKADIVQGGVQLMNVHSSWWSLRNCLEYYFWFRSRLHFHAGRGFIPLGGNTVFVRTDLLREAGGWDADCLAEDCEIGVRLSTRGARVAVAYDPELVTREETPGTLRSLVKQRTRWDQGFLQVLRKGVWRDLPTRRQRALARYTLASPFLQAFTGVMIPVSVYLMVAVKVPTWVVLLTLVPLVPALMTLVVEACGFADFCRAYGVRGRPRDYVALVLGAFPYQLLLAFAALRAVVRELRGDASWEKTEHAGAHRAPAQPDLVIDLRDRPRAGVATDSERTGSEMEAAR